MMKRVALVNPGRGKRYAMFEPLNIGFIASYLEKNNVEVTIIDELAGQNVRKELMRYRPDIVGITATTPLTPYAYEVAGICRNMGILTVMGGVHASVLPEEALQHVNIVVVGEGEVAMLDIVKHGIRSGVITYPYTRDIDEIPPPARHLMDMDFYSGTRDRLLLKLLGFVPPHTKVASMLTSRGCPFSCIFCHNSWKGMPFRFNSAERVISEMKDLKETYGIKAIFFIEDNFFANKPRVGRICDLLTKEKLNLTWGANARVDGIDEDILGVAKGAGCRQITFGFESGSQRILDILNKKTTVEQNYKAVELCCKVGIEPQGTVMFGNPTETVEDIKATQRFLEKTKLSGIGIMITTPYPGTVLWDWCKDRNLIPSKINWEDLDCDNLIIPACDTIPQKEIKRLQTESKAVMVGKEPLRVLALARRGMIPAKDVVSMLKHPLRIVKTLWRILRYR